jgi:hypothetical protein
MHRSLTRVVVTSSVLPSSGCARLLAARRTSLIVLDAMLAVAEIYLLLSLIFRGG